MKNIEDKVNITAKYLPTMVRSARHQMVHRNSKILVPITGDLCKVLWVCAAQRGGNGRQIVRFVSCSYISGKEIHVAMPKLMQTSGHSVKIRAVRWEGWHFASNVTCGCRICCSCFICGKGRGSDLRKTIASAEILADMCRCWVVSCPLAPNNEKSHEYTADQFCSAPYAICPAEECGNSRNVSSREEASAATASLCRSGMLWGRLWDAVGMLLGIVTLGLS